MIYLDHAATSLQKPQSVYQAADAAMRTCASLGRSGHPAAVRAAQVAYRCRRTAAALFDAQPEQVVFTCNCTHGLNIAIRSLVHPGDPVVISGFEHNAVLRPLHRLGAGIRVAGQRLFDRDEALAAFDAAITPEVRAVICTHVSNVFGYILPVEEIAALCQDRGVPFVLDAAQSGGVLPISLKRLGAAFVAMPGHKGLYGPQGTGLLLCGRVPEPLLCGGTGSRSQDPDMPDYLPDAAEAGTHNVPGIAGLLAGLEFVQSQGADRILRHEQSLLGHLCSQLAGAPHLKLFCGSEADQTGVLSLQVSGWDCELAAAQLAELGFAVRAGLHCAPMAHRCAGTLEQGTVRVSVSAFNTEQEMDDFAGALVQLK